MNQVLTALATDDRRALAPLIRRLDLPAEYPISRPGERSEWLYFPGSAVVSLISDAGHGGPVEIATVGNEGVVGVEHVLGCPGLPFGAVVQRAGYVECLPTSALQLDALRHMLRRFARALLVQGGQTSACVRVHPLEQRLARWLLTVRDRSCGDRLALTQSSIARALGVGRASVNTSLGMLQRVGFVATGRGVVRILDRAGLELTACACYAIVREANERALRPA